MTGPDTPLTILFVDDERYILDIASEYFEMKGYRVITAANGAEALVHIRNEKIDCCFTDIHMPEMDGLELAENIRKMDNTLPVVVMTGYPSLDNIIHTLRNGVVDFLIKPVNLNQMEISLRSVLRERRLFMDNLFLKQEVEKKEQLERLNRKLHVRVEELRLFNRIMERFTTTRRTVDILRVMTELALEIVRGDDARFFLANGVVSPPYLIAAASREKGKDECLGPDDPEGGPTVPPAAEDDEEEEWLRELAREMASERVEHPLALTRNNGDGLSRLVGMAAPLFIRDRIFGILTAVRRHGPDQPSETMSRQMEFLTRNAAYAIENLALYENICDNLLATLDALIEAIDARDTYTRRHSNEVTELALALARVMGRGQEDIDTLTVAGPLHDVGKIGIRDEILLKPDGLTPREHDIIKTHSVIGAKIVGRMGLWERERLIIRHHHERYDGKGYPDGLAGDRIPLLARILSVADTYNAMTTNRVYRPRMSREKAIRIILENAGIQFDPDVVAAFRHLLDTGHSLV